MSESIKFSQSQESKHFEEMREKHPRLFMQFCLNLLNKGENEIGQGNAAKVFFLGRNPKYCAKVLKEYISPETFQLSIEQEFHMQERASRVCPDSVPKPIVAYNPESESESMGIILMERVPGVSIRDVLEGRSDLPENFNFQEFFIELRKQVAKLHDNKIYHRDLHDGNVMIDDETGMPRIIDFGMSTISFGDDDVSVYRYKSHGLKETRLMNDDGAVNQIGIKLRKHLTKEA